MIRYGYAWPAYFPGACMYAAILHLSFPPARHDEVARFLVEEMVPVIRDNAGFIDLRVLDAHSAGELVMIDTWLSEDDSRRAAQTPAAVAVHDRFAELQLSVTSATRYAVIATS